MTIGKAMKGLKQGKRAYREAWSRGYIYLVPANRYRPTTDVGFDIAEDGYVPYADYIAYLAAPAPVQMWAPTHADLLADDWVVCG